jgi:hypothetical protein
LVIILAQESDFFMAKVMPLSSDCGKLLLGK